MTAITSPLAAVSVGCAAIAAVLLIAYLVRRPPLVRLTKIWLFCALGVFPIAAAMTGNVEGYETTKARTFCASCHVMIPHTSDSNDLTSHSLSSRHGRNKLFGDENCYTCHADYGMFGTITTKLGGMRHVWMYYTQYRNTPLEEAKRTIHLYEPYPNDNCMQCHSTKGDIWLAVPDHHASLEELRAGRLSCASGGCHGFAHPSTKSAELLDLGRAPAAPSPGAPSPEAPSPEAPSAQARAAAQTVRADAGIAPMPSGAR